MEAGGARVAVDVAFGSGGGFGDGAELAGEEGEVSHVFTVTLRFAGYSSGLSCVVPNLPRQRWEKGSLSVFSED